MNFEYRVMYKHFDDTVVEFASGITEETAERVLRDTARTEDTREWWIERRYVNPWERVS